MRITDSQSGKEFYQKRLRRYDIAGDARELTFSCFHGFPFLNRDRTRQWFVDALDAARLKWPIDLWAYVIMPEHVHLLVYPRLAKLKLGPVAGWIKEQVARRAIAHLEEYSPQWLSRITVREGSKVRRRIWQPGGGYDRNVLEISTIPNMVDYFHDNPVRRKLVKNTQEWDWSSAKWYAGIRPVPIEMDATIPMFHCVSPR